MRQQTKTMFLAALASAMVLVACSDSEGTAGVAEEKPDSVSVEGGCETIDSCADWFNAAAKTTSVNDGLEVIYPDAERHDFGFVDPAAVDSIELSYISTLAVGDEITPEINMIYRAMPEDVNAAVDTIESQGFEGLQPAEKGNEVIRELIFNDTNNTDSGESQQAIKVTSSDSAVTMNWKQKIQGDDEIPEFLDTFFPWRSDFAIADEPEVSLARVTEKFESEGAVWFQLTWNYPSKGKSGNLAAMQEFLNSKGWSFSSDEIGDGGSACFVVETEIERAEVEICHGTFSDVYEVGYTISVVS